MSEDLTQIKPILDTFLATAGKLPLARFEVEMEVSKAGSLPVWLGSTLRGAFGHAFKQTVCMVAHGECNLCLLRARCPYMYVFETVKPQQSVWMKKYDRIPHPFILHPPVLAPREYLGGETFSFQFSLFGAAIEFLPYLILSWEQMGLQGLGKDRLPLRLLSVRRLSLAGGPEQIIFTPGSTLQGNPEQWGAPLNSLLPIQAPKQRATPVIHWVTPVRLSASSGPVLRDIPFSLLLSGLLRRLSMLAYFHAGIQADVDFKALTKGASAIGIVHSELRWQNLPRYSNRQKKAMNFGGLSGSLGYDAEARVFLPLLHLGQWLHVGKNTSFGLGQYRLPGVEL